MRKNLKIALVSIGKDKVQSAISLLGFGIGLGCIILLMLLYMHEKSFDRYIPDNQHVYRVIQGDNCFTSYPLGDAIKETSPAINAFFRYYQASEVEIKNHQNDIVKDKLFAFSDASIYQCLGIQFKQGSAARSKTEIAISRKTALAYFGNQAATGKILQVRLDETFIPLTVSGVYNDFPSNSTLCPEFIADINLMGEILNQEQKMFGQYKSEKDAFKNWNEHTFYTYLQLKPLANPDEVAESLQQYRQLMNNENRKEMVFTLQPVTDIYMKSTDLSFNYITRLGNEGELVYYIAIAALILFISMINYIFLTKAKINSRLKDMGVQKALGASRSTIQRQILFESNLVSFLGLIPAFIVIFSGIPFINSTLNRTLDVTIFSDWKTWIVIISVILFTGSLSGILIGSTVSRIPAVLLLTGKSFKHPKSHRWSGSFLCLHFSIFIILVASVFVLKRQINYSLTGFRAIDPTNVLIYELNTPELSAQMPVIKNEIDKLPGVVTSAGSSFIPPFDNILPVKLQYQGESIVFDGLIMGKGMVSLLGMQLTDGEDFGEFQADRRDVIFNELAATKYHLKAGDTFNGFFVRGIVNDFNVHSMRNLIKPTVIIQQDPQQMGLFAIKTTGTNDAAIKKAVYHLLKKTSPDKIVNTYSLTDQINLFYGHEQNQAKLIGAFSLLAVILCIMGLFGITYNTILRKTKEIGIRKVNGARISEVMIALNRDFAKWVILAFVIAMPVAYFAMNKWLEQFAYKTTLSWWIFALAGLLAFGVALLTVSLQSWKAAARNPVEALKYE